MRPMVKSILVAKLVLVSGAVMPVLAAGAPGAEKGSAFPAFDSSSFAGQLFWLAITFGLLYFLMKNVALPRVAGIIEERRSTIDSALAAASAAQKSAEEQAVALEAAMAKARANSQAIAAEARAKSARDIDTTRQAVEKDLAGKMVAAEARITDTKIKAMANVDEIARDAVGAIIEQLTGKGATADAVAKAIGAARK